MHRYYCSATSLCCGRLVWVIPLVATTPVIEVENPQDQLFHMGELEEQLGDY
jgi:hypothetical protein